MKTDFPMDELTLTYQYTQVLMNKETGHRLLSDLYTLGFTYSQDILFKYT